MNTEYSALLRELEERQEASLRRTVDGKTYTRAFTLKERLILLGAGHVSQATAQLAAWADFDVTVVDDRSAFASADRFPDAKEIICENFSSAIRNRLHIRPHDYVCVLTRGHRSDAECLRAVLPGEMPLYLGMIGSRRRVTAQIRLLEEEGFDPRRLSLIHTPIGLHIHAQTPREIAVSIVAELILN